VAPPSGSMQPLPPWLKGGQPSRSRSGTSLGWLRGPALVLVGGALGWMLHAWRQPSAPLASPAAPDVVAVQAPAACPAPLPCVAAVAASPLHPIPHTKGKVAARPAALNPLPADDAPTAENRREALRAFAQQKASDLRGCLGDPGRGPLRRVGAALEIDGHGMVAAVQILGGDSGSRALESCYSAHLRTWRFPQALLQGDERLLVNFVL
jgi:hypothetical protein